MINIDMEDDLYGDSQKFFVILVQCSHYCSYFFIDFILCSFLQEN